MNCPRVILFRGVSGCVSDRDPPGRMTFRRESVARYGLDGFEGIVAEGGGTVGAGSDVFFASITLTRTAASLVREELGYVFINSW